MLQQFELDWLTDETPAPIDLDPATTDRVRAELVSYTRLEATRRRRRLLTRLPRLRARHAVFAGASAAAAFGVLLVAGVGGGVRHAGNLGGLGVQSASAAPLVRLSAKLADAPAPTGDATLVIRQQINQTTTESIAELFADDGKFYATPTAAELPKAISANETLEGSDAEVRDIAAAKSALGGPIAVARREMSIANLQPGITPKAVEPGGADLAKREKARHTPGYSPPSALDNENHEIWNNSMDALVAGAGDPQVRAGVLALLATIPQITITQSNLEGQTTMVIDYANPREHPNEADYHEQLIISSSTGVPAEFLGGHPGQAPDAIVHYKISRVTLSRIAHKSNAGS